VLTTEPAWAAGVCAGLHAAGCRHVIYVPDNPLSHVLRVIDTQYSDLQTTLATREEEAIGIAAGVYLGGGRPAVMLQSSGLGNALNGIASLLVPYQIPVAMVVSMRGESHEWNVAQVPLGRAVRAILDAIAVPHATPPDPGSVGDTIRTAATTAFSTRLPVACLLPRHITVPPATPGERAAASEPRARRGDRGGPASARAGGTGGDEVPPVRE
jgi:sulfopyruvate decarboxylase alpha subunit